MSHQRVTLYVIGRDGYELTKTPLGPRRSVVTIRHPGDPQTTFQNQSLARAWAKANHINLTQFQIIPVTL